MSVLRLDCDLYESTIQSLAFLYPKLSPGGYVIIDDYNAIEPCRWAVTDYLESHSITVDLFAADWSAVHWRKPSG